MNGINYNMGVDMFAILVYGNKRLIPFQGWSFCY